MRENIVNRLKRDEPKATAEGMTQMKRRILASDAPDGTSSAFIQTLFHEYSHRFANTCDFYYVGSIDGRLQAMNGADVENAARWNMGGDQLGLLPRAKVQLLPDLLIANADNVGCYLANWIEPRSSVVGLKYKIR